MSSCNVTTALVVLLWSVVGTSGQRIVSHRCDGGEECEMFVNAMSWPCTSQIHPESTTIQGWSSHLRSKNRAATGGGQFLRLMDDNVKIQSTSKKKVSARSRKKERHRQAEKMKDSSVTS